MLLNVQPFNVNVFQQYSACDARKAPGRLHGRSPDCISTDYENVGRCAFADLSELIQQNHFIETTFVRFFIPNQIL